MGYIVCDIHNKRTYETDYNFGEQAEKEFHPYLNTYRRKNFEKESRFNIGWDFYCGSEKKETWELKRRRLRHTSEPDSWFPLHKIYSSNCGNKPVIDRFHTEDDYHHYIAVWFDDGIYSIKFDEELFASFETDDVQRTRVDKRDQIIKNYKIPISALTRWPEKYQPPNPENECLILID